MSSRVSCFTEVERWLSPLCIIIFASKRKIGNTESSPVFHISGQQALLAEKEQLHQQLLSEQVPLVAVLNVVCSISK